MSKFNKTKRKVTPTSVNEMGEKAYELTAKEELVATVLTSFFDKSYYESEKEITKRLKTAIKEVDTHFIAQLAIYTRTQANMRTMSHFLAGELAARLSGKEYAKRFYDKIVVRPDDMSEILSYLLNVKGINSIPNAVRKGFKTYCEKLNPYQIDKYKMKTKEISLVDIFNLVHPKANQSNSEAFRRLMNGESLDDLYEGVIFEKAKSKAGKDSEARSEAFTEVLTNIKGMPYMNLLRNLRAIIIERPDLVDEAVRQLTIKDKILKSRQLPFRFVSAYKEVAKLKSASTSVIVFEQENYNSNVDKVLNALEKALEISCHNIVKLEGNTAILIDHSGSVRGDGGGSSLVSKFSSVTSATIGNLFGMMLAYAQNNVYVGMFGDRLKHYKYDRNVGILKNHNASFELGANCGMGTENGIYIFLKDVIENRKKVDNLFVFSDMVIGSGSMFDVSSNASKYGSFQTLLKEFRKINPQCNIVSIDIRQTSGKSVMDKSLGVTQVAGWSDKIFNIMESSCKGYGKLIKEIESIKI